MSKIILSKKIAQGFYPERRASSESKLDNIITDVLGKIINPIKTRPGSFYTIVDRVNALQDRYKYVNENEFKTHADNIRQDIRNKGMDIDMVAHVFALVREVSGVKLNMRHYNSQLIGGWVLLNGMIAEMETGEGKTLTATLPACAAAFAGIPVHILTVNDYLVERDAELMGPVYEALGIQVGIITHEKSLKERQKAYGADVTYCTHKEIVFDYLKDRIVLGRKSGHIQMRISRLYETENRLDQLRLRGLSFAIIDEADNILIDDARTPLIISNQTGKDYEEQVYSQAIELSAKLKPVEDYFINDTGKALSLTEEGKLYLEKISHTFDGVWKGKHLREELVRQALTALHLYTKDKDYIVKDKSVLIIDEYTGRAMADRKWERGLHQLIEAKEECEITPQNEPLVRISYQRFFSRYHHIAGMSGTAKEVTGELWTVYRLPVVSVPANRNIVRHAYPTNVYRKTEEKWWKIVNRISQLFKDGRPVLVGTRSVSTSEYLSKLLTTSGLPHRVLNARQDKEEAEIIAQAGQKGGITVATNMAGRGTDIDISSEINESGGLHVIATEPNESRRIDRQLFGRCGRQGNNGSYELIASIEDELLTRHMEKPFGQIVSKWTNPDTVLGRWVGNKYISYAQKSVKKNNYHIRRNLMKLDVSCEKNISFSGSSV
ncbi:MAG: preprotein translocase subunit SecA [Planctomycetes bacterium]|nr:preprotein translocase subunit SecA [Planctomycetota bacterium]